MAFTEEDKGGAPSKGGTPPAPEQPPEAVTVESTYGDEDNYDGYPTDDYSSPADDSPSSTAVVTTEPEAVAPPVASGAAPPTPPPPKTEADESDDDDEKMLRMSFLEHLEELRSRIIKALLGIGIAFVLSLTFTNELWRFVAAPAVGALKSLGFPNPGLTQITPMEVFNVVWVKLPILCAIFIASPWVLYQVWGFISPGLYKRERRWAAPFIICSAGLFVLGGIFAYFVAFRFGLTFLLSIGRGNYITPMVSVTEYFDLFVNVILGVAIVFELPVLIFFLTLLHVVNPGFLIRNSRYAILGIFLLAAVITPTPDIFNLVLFATPMSLLFYVGVFASYLLVLHRENRRFPWGKALGIAAIIVALIAAGLYVYLSKSGYHLVPAWPFITR